MSAPLNYDGIMGTFPWQCWKKNPQRIHRCRSVNASFPVTNVCGSKKTHIGFLFKKKAAYDLEGNVCLCCLRPDEACAPFTASKKNPSKLKWHKLYRSSLKIAPRRSSRPRRNTRSQTLSLKWTSLSLSLCLDFCGSCVRSYIWGPLLISDHDALYIFTTYYIFSSFILKLSHYVLFRCKS